MKTLPQMSSPLTQNLDIGQITRQSQLHLDLLKQLEVKHFGNLIQAY